MLIPRPKTPCTFLEAVAIMEGFYVPDSRPSRNNNPGDLEFRGWEVAFKGSLETGHTQRFAIFPTSEDGFNAMRHLILTSYVGLSVAAALNKWAPPVENETSNYITVVCKLTGLTEDTILTAANIG